MTVIHKDHKVTARASLRDWAVLVVMLGSFFSAGVVAWQKLESKADAAESKARQTETDLAEFKDKIDAKLEKISADTAYLRGVIGRARPSPTPSN